MSNEVVIKVADKVPELVSMPPRGITCDNSDYTVVWQLDEEWAKFEHRTMQVNYSDGTYERVLFTGDSCALPAIPVKDWFYVGLFAGDIHTTRPLRLFGSKAVTTGDGEERTPMPNGYAQAIAALDGKLDRNQGAANAGKALVINESGDVVPGTASSGGGGADGKSAYEIAVENGFEGDEKAWLVSLKGEKGDTGAKGATGPRGPQGEKGEQGPKGDTGPAGADGKPGADGAPGADGITPTIGSNGNWYLGTTDTGKPSRGEQGPAGVDGTDGKDGAPGKDGADGAPGKDGAGLDVTGASVGQIVKIAAVDASGKPTEWESYFPGYRLLCTQTLEEEANAINWAQDADGKAFDFTGLQEVTLALAFPSDYTSDNLTFFGFGDGSAFSNGDTFRYAIAKNTFFSPKIIYKESIVFKSTTYQWQNGNAVRRQYYATFTESQDALHPAGIELKGNTKAFPIGTIASVYVR